MEKLKFKVGERVRVKSLEWYNSKLKNRHGIIQIGVSFTKSMSWFCGKEITIRDCENRYYRVLENAFIWQDWMLEDEVVAEEKQEQLNKNYMKELKIEIPTGYEIDQEKSTFEKIIFKKIETKLPKTWEEFCEQNPIKNLEFFIDPFSGINGRSYQSRQRNADRNLLSTKEDAEAHLALMQLHRLRDVYRQGWTPNWNDGTGKYCILFNPDNLDIVTYTRAPHFLSFQSREIAEEFIKNFKDLIEKIKGLIS